MKHCEEITLQHVRSTSYTSKPAWILCRNFDQCPVADDAGLIQWTQQGCVRPGDYLVSTRLNRCVQAKDVAELDAIFRTATAQRLETAVRALAVGGFALVWIAPWLGALALFSAIGTTVVSIAKTSYRPGKYMTKLMEASPN
jgi:hypothetical protein